MNYKQARRNVYCLLGYGKEKLINSALSLFYDVVIFSKLYSAEVSKPEFSISNLSLFSLYYAEACNEFAGPIPVSLHPGNIAPFEEM